MSKPLYTKAGWEIYGDTPCDDFGLFRTRKSRRKNIRNGFAMEFFLIDGLDWAHVIALTPRNEVVLVNQFRHGTDEMSLELPGGCIESGEDPKEGTVRELQEETGYRADNIELLGVVRPNPAMFSNRCYIYLAHNAVPHGEIDLDPGESIEVVLTPLEQMQELITSGKFTHGLHVAAFGLYWMKQGASS